MEIDITCDGTEYIDFKKLIPFQGDLKTITDENLQKLKNSIIKYGFTVPAFVWRDGGAFYILDAHQRMKALDSLFHDGYEIPDIPIIHIEADNEKEAKEKLLQVSSQYGEFSEQGFADFLLSADLDLSELEIRLTNEEFSIADPKEAEETEGDDEVNDDVKPITKLGDLWELGNHRVLCGDSTESKTVSVLMDGQKADMVFTDPPYGMGLDTDYEKVTGFKNAMHKKKGKDAISGKKYKSVKGDNEDFTPDLIETVFNNFGYCKEIFLWGADYYSEYINARNEGSWIVWDKITTKEGIVSEGASKMFGSCFELCWSKMKHKRDIIRMFHKGFTSVDNSEKVHPTQKPIQLTEWFINKWDCKKVVDLFLGSGSTLIACEKTNHICYGMELDEHYCDVIVNRYIDWCNKNDRTPIVKLNGKVYDYSKTIEGTIENG